MLEVISSKAKHNCFKSTFSFLSGLSYLGNSNKCSYSFCIAHVSSVPWVTQYSTTTAFRMSRVRCIGLISVMETDFFKEYLLNKGFVFITSEDCLEMLL